jgi:hypothetical protein
MELVRKDQSTTSPSPEYAAELVRKDPGGTWPHIHLID